MADRTARRDAVIEWLLVEYDEVLSTPPPDDTITELAALAGQNPAEFLQRYWQERPGYDLGWPAARQIGDPQRFSIHGGYPLRPVAPTGTRPPAGVAGRSGTANGRCSPARCDG